MFAFFGLGPHEVLILAVLGVGGVAAVAVAVRAGRRDRAADLEAENRRLRDELDRRERRP